MSLNTSTPFSEDSHPLDAIFKPRNVAVIGATEKAGSVGRTIVWNLLSNPFGGTVFPINPNKPSVMGIKTYPNIGAVPDKVDLAVIVTPAPTVPGVIRECNAAGVRGAIIISAGFKEVGAAGAALEAQVLAAAGIMGDVGAGLVPAPTSPAATSPMRIIGPNCLGVMNTRSGLNATFASSMARPGNVAFLSQSGALCTAVLDWSLREGVGFSHFVSVGSMLDVDWGDLLYYMGDDEHTRSIIMYCETIGDARSFMSAAREVSISKPIILIKPGRTAGAAQAAASHTGALTGSDDVVDAALRRAGVIRVSNISDLFYMSEALARQPKPRGRRLTIVTNAGGPGVLATDALIAGGGELALPSEAAMTAYNALLPAAWSHHNPIDVLGDASPDRYAQTLKIAASDENTDGMLVVLTPQAMTDPTQTAEALRTYASGTGKPVLASWMGGNDVAAGEAILNKAGIATFPYPDTACRIWNYMWQYNENLRALYETPNISVLNDEQATAGARAIIATARAEQRTLLTETESKALLAAYDIPTVQTLIARSADDAVVAAKAMGFPVVLKLYSHSITHKTDVGGVQLNLRTDDAVRNAWDAIKTGVSEKAGVSAFDGVTVQPMIELRDGYELILGSSLDAQFGPVIVVGSGGQLVEVFKDSAIGLPPLNSNFARMMLEHTQIYTALKGVRGRASVDIDALERLMVRFSTLVTDLRADVREIDINPLLVSPPKGERAGNMIALDARVVLHPSGMALADLPRMAIRPYPARYISAWNLRDGTAVTVRPIRASDEPLVAAFHAKLSEQSVYLRYFAPISLSTRISHERLSRICFNDYDREIALVVERIEADGKPMILGIGRLVRTRDGSEGEYGILVRDDQQRQGVGTELLRRLVDIGRAEGLQRITAEILPENTGMRRASEKVGFTVKYEPTIQVVRSVMTL